MRFLTEVCNASCQEIPPARSWQGAIIFGGGERIKGGPPWLSRELLAIEPALEEKPILGICLGAQIIFHLLGGKVERAPVGEYGFPKMYVSSKDTLLEGISTKPRFYSFHQDLMLPPEGAEVFLRSSLCLQGIRFGQMTTGVQFHPEITLPLALWRNRNLGFLLEEAGLGKTSQSALFALRSPWQRHGGECLLKNWAREAWQSTR